MVSNAASMVLFPNIAGEKDEAKRSRITPIVCRTAILITAIISLIFYLVSNWLIVFLYSPVFTPAIKPFQILLLGVVSLVAWQIISYDLSGRGRPELNTYIYGTSVLLNIVLNIYFIPRIGIEGAAWSSVFSYTAASLGGLYVYCRITNNPWVKVIFPQISDLQLYMKIINNFRGQK
jgi:O-antigen/teichoic acid export membrane protein